MHNHLDLQRRQQNGTASASGSATVSGSASLVNGSTPLPSVSAGAPPGAITITMPPIQSTSYYKLAPSEYITFGWNFSSISVAPTSLTVAAVGANGYTYPVGPTDGVIPGNAQSVVWYPYGYQTADPSLPLVQASYTLHIWGDGGPSAVPTPGYLAPYSGLVFAIYTPQAYTPLTSGWQCAGCSGALPQLKIDSALPGVVAMIVIMLLSGFTTLRRVWD
ncbi:uncharacterized protein EDB91DRAFT_1051686 [Suillus paluster]|uniref:uncharacterized protein n=1 Tax=Suillus paluster TaxID=48578 RepID=UPI001B87373E|nr:uncharacterized protein EDB91DRAFT_1051686 [Suillus paluster]KAG1742742.1 hypothetical protein EDB91DRAFT_1051686 [Suillus paluster]